ncbi:CHAT domain-containing protein [Sphingomonas changbaiensis]|uniref:CHAT domain-containing protein n=1 Tax=Sphingomonas changbaiensis TaxID=529705 RepID=UPI001FDFECE6|nr:CHAT domain-containing tetratricopeptide repeat protein [Sphingomonas changbaiensis]
MRALMLAAGLVGILGSTPLVAANQRPSLQDSFALGSDAESLCQVESKGRDPAIGGIFDRAWVIICRDASRPIGHLYGLRGNAEAIAQRLAAIRVAEARCDAAAGEATIEDLGSVSRTDCRLNDADVGYRVYQVRRGDTVWVAEGLSGYDDALKLGLRTVVADRIVPGKIEVATTGGSDPIAFARVQAGSLDPDRALAEGYRRNNAGAYAEAAEFFGTLQQRADMDRTGEYLINEALQKSNLGQFAEADRLFAEAERIPTADRVQTRLRRNFLTLHLINQQKLDAALAELDRPVVPLTEPMRVIGGAVEIGNDVAAEINSGTASERLGTTEAGQLTPEERAIILDAQALQLRGTVYRLKGRNAEALPLLEEALRQAQSVRQGRVVSIIRLRSQILAETGAALEGSGNAAGAEQRFRESIALLEQRYPDTNVVAAARSRLAAFLVRQNRLDDALALYKAVVADVVRRGNSTTGMSNMLAPYFETLVQRAPANPALVDDFFLATQTLVRPGVADTQTQLARQLSQGAGEAASLFRQATVLQREVERSRIGLASLRNADQPNDAAITAAAAELDKLERDQAVMQAKLSAFPQYRALSTDTLSIADLRAALKPDEAYLKLAVVGQTVYGTYITPTDAAIYRLPITADQLDTQVDNLRATVSTVEDGQVFTYPFNLTLARNLYVELTGPVADKVARSKAVIFEPDGAMLRLPLALLPTDQASVDRYVARAAKPGADKFDFTGVQWLGRTARISTAVSARGFRDARRAAPSSAQKPYLGFGENAPAFTRVSLARGPNAADPCQWPLSEWNKPISAQELKTAEAALGPGSDVVTGAAFTDEAVMARPDLANYRILHFATHGFVTAPQPQCPARPALLTSFGDAQSDGLLSFKEIYDLHMDADLVLLSACDTAGRATVAATREAGVTTGGGSALDGLVRAFIGGGARSVLASHWPAPDEFQATERLIGGLFQASPGTSIGRALQAGQVKLMDDARTSHPFYWAGFVLVGDGAQPLVRMK